MQNMALYQKTNQQSQGSLVPFFFFFLNNCFPYFFLTNSANILYLKEITLAHVGVWVSRMASLSQLELDGYCNYLGKEHFPKFTWESSTDQNKDHWKDGSLALIHLVFFEHVTTSYYSVKCSFWHWGEAHMFWFSSWSGEQISWVFLFGPAEADYELFKCVS